MKSSIVLFLMVISWTVKSQNTDEWFHQKKTQKKYLVDQIAALRVYADYVKKGYNVLHQGLTTVENITNGHFAIDQSFFDSHRNVKPAIANSIKVANIVGYQVMIIRDFRKLYESCKHDPGFSADEVLYLGHVYANMLRLCDISLAELRDVLQAGTLEMTDDERLNRIDAIHQDMSDKYAFVQAFGNDTHLLGAMRSKERTGISAVGDLHGYTEN